MTSADEKIKLTAVRQILSLGDNKPPSRVTGSVQHEHTFGQKVQDALRIAQERREDLDARTIAVGQ